MASTWTQERTFRQFSVGLPLLGGTEEACTGGHYPTRERQGIPRGTLDEELQRPLCGWARDKLDSQSTSFLAGI